MILVNVHIKVKPECRESFLNYMEEMMPICRSDRGNLLYLLKVSIDNPYEFMIYEKWESIEDLKNHSNQPFFKPMLSKLSELVSEPFVGERYEVLI